MVAERDRVMQGLHLRPATRITAGMFALLALVVAGLAAARQRARRDWPTDVLGPVTIAPAVAPDADAWPALQRAMDAFPRASGRAITALRDAHDLTAIDAALAATLPALSRFEQALTHGGLVVPRPAALGEAEPSLQNLMHLANAWVLRARVRAARGDAARALQDLATLERYATGAAHGDNGILTQTLALVIERRLLEELPNVVTSASGIDATAAAPMEVALVEARRRGTTLPAVVAGECRFFEAALRLVGTSPTPQMRQTAVREGLRVLPRVIPTSWGFDADVTFAAHRHHCHARVHAARGAPGQRLLPPRRSYLHDGVVGEWLDNRVGRELLEVMLPAIDRAMTRHMAREDDVIALRSAARVALEIGRFRRERGALPAQVATPGDLAGRSLRWGSAAGELRLHLQTRSSERREPLVRFPFASR